MKTIIAITIAAFLFAACGSGTSTTPVVNDSTTVDSTKTDSIKVDTVTVK